MLKVAVVTMVALGVMVASLSAEVTVSGSAAVQVTKKASDYSTGNIDESWARGEVKIAGKKESGLSGMVHLRAEPKFTSGMKGIDLQPRQIYFKLPVSVVDLMAGRWYEVYGNGNYYFGQYLFGVGKNGNGSMNVDYKPLDGMKATVNIASIKSAFHLGVLPADMKFEKTSLLAEFSGNPIEALKFTIGANFEVITPDDSDYVNLATVNAAYTIMKDLNFSVFGEAAVTDFSETSENAWFLIGAASKIPMVLDRIQAEFEIKNHRHGTEAADNLAWMVMLRKKVTDLTFDLNIGADPATLGSQSPSEVGVIFRTSASF